MLLQELDDLGAERRLVLLPHLDLGVSEDPAFPVEEGEGEIALGADVEASDRDAPEERREQELAEMRLDEAQRLGVAALLDLEADVLLDDREQPLGQGLAREVVQQRVELGARVLAEGERLQTARGLLGLELDEGVDHRAPSGPDGSPSACARSWRSGATSLSRFLCRPAFFSSTLARTRMSSSLPPTRRDVAGAAAHPDRHGP